MTLNLTINEGAAPPAPVTPGTFNVLAYYTETSGGQPFGPFATREQAEACILALSTRPGVVKATLETV